ncbi:flagellar biosynthetic protein FliR [Roseivivax sp. CAU 1753]
MTGIEALMGLSTATLWAGGVVFLRAGAVMSVLPGLGEQTVPMRIRLALALALCVIATPAIMTDQALPQPSLGSISLLVFTEAIAGLALGLALRFMVMALQIAGSIAAQATSLSQLLGGAAGEPMPTIGHILTMAGLALLMLTGMHVKAVSLLILSYNLMPVGAFPDPASLGQWGRSAVSHAFVLAFTLAAPFVLISVLYNLMLGVINRAMPQLMVALVGAPLITFGAISMLAISAPYLLQVWINAVDAVLANPFGRYR